MNDDKQPMPAQLTQLLSKLEKRTALIGIVGLGYVGLPLMLRYVEVGFKVLGIDIDADKVARLNQGQSYIEHISAASIADACSRGFEATTDFARAAEADALIICVPTPLNAYREPDLSFVLDTVDALLPHIRPGQVMSLESTTYPGTTDEELQPRIESRGLTVGDDVFLVFSPEREDPGNPNFETRTIPKVCGGTTPACLAGRHRPLRAGDRPRRAGQFDARRGADQAAREHPPRREHRPGQRDEDHRRQDGDRHP